eukprot:CAMPEP_0181469816 /NCGR_PEP_ID=MMETSP1110-20121109/38221_1 /TAXON_ID=174948 /ORGANISM="Symbiodinium sp., Strain CCMP421" /LENGTH=258 /DNA_ID=CAMNT_0023594749 /DNA_START=76 /DNA_END=852 /DNA_ORIENTATION=-
MARFLAALAMAVVDAHCLYDNVGALQSCGRGCFSKPGASQASCVSGCLSGRGVSYRCSRCLGSGFTCALRSCRSACSSGLSTSQCTSCIAGSCGLCSGATKSMQNETDAVESMAKVLTSLKDHKDLGETPETAEKESESVAPVAQPSVKSGCYENQGLLKTCGTQCFSAANRGVCATNCLKGKGMSSACASCFGGKVDCTIKNCLSTCMSNSQSAACKSCVRSKCGRCSSEKSAPNDDFLSEVAAAAIGKAEEAALYP